MSEDLISKQTAYKVLSEYYHHRTETQHKALREALDMVPSAQPEPRWIPCSEMPDTDRNVFIARGTPEIMTVCVGHYQHDYERWYEDRNWFAICLYDGLYWCEIPPLPEPYKGGRDE